MKAHHRLKTFIKVFLSLIVILVISLFGALQWPGLWLHADTMNWARNELNDHFPKIHLQWDHMEVMTSSTGLLSNRLLFEFENFCFKKEKQLETCFRTLKVGFAYNLPALKLSEFGPIRAGGGNLWYHDVLAAEQSPSNSKALPEIPRFLAEAEIKPIYIEVGSYKIQALEKVLRGHLLVTSSSQSQLQGEEQTIKVQLQEQTWGDVSASATTLTEKVKGPWKFHSESDLQLPNHSTLHTVADLDPQEADRYSFQISTQYQSPGPDADLQLSGHYQDGTVSAVLNGQVKAGAEIQFADCEINLKQLGNDQAQAQTNCPVLLSVQQFRQKRIHQFAQTLKNPNVGARVLSNVTTQFPPKLTQKISGRVELKPMTSFSQILESRGGLTSQFQLTPSKWKDIEDLEVNVDWTAQVRDFKKLVELLDQTPLAVPTPFSILEGPFLIKVQGHFTEMGGKLQSLVRTKFESKYQAIKTESTANFSLSLENLKLKKINVVSDVNLEKIQLVLPPIESLPPSQMLPDRRIQRIPLAERAKKSKRNPLPLTYQIRIHTPKQTPVRLLSNVTEKPAEIGLDFSLQDHQPVRGTIDLEAVNYEIAGVQGTLGGLQLQVRSSGFQTVATGKVLDEDNDVQARLVYAESPMDSVVRPQPKLPIPLVELATVVGLQDPLSLAVVDQRRPNAPQNQRSLNAIPLQIRRRY